VLLLAVLSDLRLVLPLQSTYRLAAVDERANREAGVGFDEGQQLVGGDALLRHLQLEYINDLLVCKLLHFYDPGFRYSCEFGAHDNVQAGA